MSFSCLSVNWNGHYLFHRSLLPILQSFSLFKWGKRWPGIKFHFYMLSVWYLWVLQIYIHIHIHTEPAHAAHSAFSIMMQTKDTILLSQIGVSLWPHSAIQFFWEMKWQFPYINLSRIEILEKTLVVSKNEHFYPQLRSHTMKSQPMRSNYYMKSLVVMPTKN